MKNLYLNVAVAIVLLTGCASGSAYSRADISKQSLYVQNTGYGMQPVRYIGGPLDSTASGGYVNRCPYSSSA